LSSKAKLVYYIAVDSTSIPVVMGKAPVVAATAGAFLVCWLHQGG
jgi:hypothetical protein